MPPAVPMWLRMVKDVRMPRFRRAMQRPLVTATRRLFSGIACHIAAKHHGPPLGAALLQASACMRCACIHGT